MYLIIKHDFDNKDNCEPHYNEVVGYTDGEIEAIRWINNVMGKINQYKGLDGCTYPYYTKRYITKLV